MVSTIIWAMAKLFTNFRRWNMKTRIGNFVTSIVTLLVASFLYYLLRDLTVVDHEGLKALSLVVVWPVYLIIYLLSFGVCLTSIINSIKSLTSHLGVIKVLSIILLILGVALIGLNILTLKIIF